MRPTGWSFAALLVFALPALGQGPPPPPPASTDPAASTEVDPGADLAVHVDATLGYAGRVPDDGFVPVIVDLVDRGAPVTASVVLRASEGGAVLLRLGPVDLDGTAPRRLTGVVPARPIVESGGLHVDALDPEGRLVGSAVVYPDATQGRVLVALDRRGATPSDLSSLRTSVATQGNAGAEVRWYTAVLSRVEDLPAHPLAWSAAGAVLLGDLDVKDWPDGAARALAAWVVRGGDLIVSVGPRASALKRSALGKHLGEALDALPDASAPRDVNLAPLLASLAPATDGDQGAAFATAAELLEGDEVALESDGRAFAVRRRHGLGRVTLVSADLWSPPLLHHPATARLLEQLLVDGTQHSPRAREVFGELAEVRQPARVGPAFAVLIIYALVAGPGVYFVLRQRRRGILLWLAIPLITLACTALVPLYRIVLRDAESTLVGVRLVEGRAGRATAVESTDALLFSGSLDPKTLRYVGQDAVAYGVIPPRRSRRGGEPDLGGVLGGGADEASFGLPIALWGARYVAFEATARAPVVKGGVELVYDKLGPDAPEPGARLRATWEGPTLEAALLIYPAAAGPVVHALGDVRSHEQLDVELKNGGKGPVGTDLPGVILQRLIDARYAPLCERERRAFLLGQVDERSPLSAAPNVRVRAFATLYAVEIDVGYRAGIPFGAATALRTAATSVAAVDSGLVERVLTTRLRLPPSLESGPRTPAMARARVTSSRSRGVGRLSVEVLEHATGTWRTLLPIPDDADEQEGVGRRIELDLQRPAEVVDARGTVVFRQRIKRPRADVDEPYAATIEVAVGWER